MPEPDQAADQTDQTQPESPPGGPRSARKGNSAPRTDPQPRSTPGRRCSALRTDGEPCGMTPLRGTEPPVCIRHGTDEQTQELVNRLGALRANAQRAVGLPQADLKTIESSRSLLEASVQALCERKINAAEMNALSKAIKTGLELIQIEIGLQLLERPRALEAPRKVN